ncbi:MAG TPA: hypothetical protein VNW92_14665, partial [Polyangiaceae bacterium]|nr:hypothetical protein [Polyangiaceae bacterium]
MLTRKSLGHLAVVTALSVSWAVGCGGDTFNAMGGNGGSSGAGNAAGTGTAASGGASAGSA